MTFPPFFPSELIFKITAILALKNNFFIVDPNYGPQNYILYGKTSWRYIAYNIIKSGSLQIEEWS